MSGMSLRIIGAGMGRTGTHALKLALEQLGLGPCHHMFELRESPAQLSFWQAAARGESLGWDSVFAGYASQVDWPGARYWRELSEAFPDAKVILSHRDPEAWYKSFSETIVRANTIGRTQDPNPHTRAMAELINQIVFEQTFSGRTSDKDHVLQVYADHLAEVKRTIPQDRLLTFDVREGWEPLCRFLGVDIPDTEFPRTNSTLEFLKRKQFLQDVEAGPEAAGPRAGG
jgi:hypothetical protein